MALRIVKSSEPLIVNQINLCIYAPPGVGKTTLAFTADDPLLLDTDKGAYRAANRKDTVQVTSWSDIAEVTTDDLAPYKTVIVDTAGRALDFLSADIIRDNPKMGRGESLTLQGFGVLKSRFASWLKRLNVLGKDVVLVAHMDEQRSGDDVLERLDVQGGSKGEIYKSSDAMGRIFIRNKQRVIDFSPRENSFGKNPAELEVLTIPHIHDSPHFLAETIALIKSRINERSAEQLAAQKIVEEWSDAIRDFKVVDDFNKNLTGIKEAPEAAKMLFFAAAKNLGFKADKSTGTYFDPKAKEVANASN